MLLRWLLSRWLLVGEVIWMCTHTVYAKGWQDDLATISLYNLCREVVIAVLI